MAKLRLRSFSASDTDQVVELWNLCGLTVPWNDPRKDIELKLQVDPELFIIAELAGRIIGTAMGGYEGHRGYIYYLGVHPDHRRLGIARKLVGRVEQLLTARNCPKINLMVRETNNEVIAFYNSMGYVDNKVISLGKRLDGVDW